MAQSHRMHIPWKPDNLRRPMLARGLEDPPPVFLHYGLGRVLVQSGIGQRRSDVGVAQGVLDPVKIDPALREPALISLPNDRTVQGIPVRLDGGGCQERHPDRLE